MHKPLAFSLGALYNNSGPHKYVNVNKYSQESTVRSYGFGAGLWVFQQLVDRYATDAYGPPVSTLEAVERAAAVGDIKVLDINYPFDGSGPLLLRQRGARRRAAPRRTTEQAGLGRSERQLA